LAPLFHGRTREKSMKRMQVNTVLQSLPMKCSVSVRIQGCHFV
jgi:hypothetical protein